MNSFKPPNYNPTDCEYLYVYTFLFVRRRHFPASLPQDVEGYTDAVEIHGRPQITRPFALHGHVEQTVYHPGGEILGSADIQLSGLEFGVCPCDLLPLADLSAYCF